MKNKRIEEIDILKGLGIILMVLCHAGGPGQDFIYLFHMSIFFMASGYFFRSDSTDTTKALLQSLKGKIRHLWFPFFLWNTIYVLLHNLLITINVYTDNPLVFNYVNTPHMALVGPYELKHILYFMARGILLKSAEPMFAAHWFIAILFFITTGYAVLDFLLKRSLNNTDIAQPVVSLVLLGAGYYCSVRHIELSGLARAASFYCLYDLGYRLSKYRKYYDDLKTPYYGAGVILCFLSLEILKHFGSVELSENQYTNPLVLLAGALAGWFFLYSLSKLILVIRPLKNILKVIGENTLSILILHFLCFKPVHLLITVYYRIPEYCIAAFPNLYGERGFWWIPMTLLGTVIPVVLSLMVQNIKRRLSFIQKS